MKALRQDTARTRKNLLMAASDIFAQKGFRDTTIGEISKRAGTNVAAVNYHFGDKETLYREAWRQSCSDSMKAYPIDGGVDMNASPMKRLAGQVFALLRRTTDAGNRAFLIGLKELANPTGLLEEVMQEEMRPLRQRISTLVREVLGPGKSDMQIRFCAISIMSQCIIPAFINMAEKPGNDSEKDSWRVDDIEGYAQHVLAFSLAGMASIGRTTKTGAGVSKQKDRTSNAEKHKGASTNSR
jgi:TetR/AcrR family transcriptional regulator, regulator of cefoperazone and chloramphenicol sensitivity